MKRVVKAASRPSSWNKAKNMYDALVSGQESYIRLWDESESNRIISVKQVDGYYVDVQWEDTVNGTEGSERMYWSSLVDLIAENIRTAEFV